MLFAYRLEQALMCASSGLLLLLYLGQALAWRFTPRRRWVVVKVRVLVLAFTGLLLQLAVSLDPSAVFGILSLGAMHALASMVTCIVMHCGALVILALCRSLYRTLQRPCPSALTATLLGATLVNHAFLFAVAVWEGVTLSQVNYDPQRLDDFLLLKDMSFVAYALVNVAAMYWATWGLNASVVGFAESLESQGTRLREVRVAQGPESKYEASSRQQAMTVAPAEEAASQVAHEPEDRLSTVTHQPTLSAPTSPLTQARSSPLGQHQLVACSFLVALPPPLITSPTSSPCAPPPLTSPAAAAPTAAASAADSTAARIAELRGGLRRLRILVALFTGAFLSALTVCWVHTASYIKGVSVEDNLPVANVEHYSVTRCLVPLTQTSAMAITLYFAWTSPSVWLRPTQPFWHTLRHGASDELLPRFEKSQTQPAPAQHRAAVAPAPAPTSPLAGPTRAALIGTLEPRDTAW